MAFMTLVAAFAGVGGGVLSWLGGTNPPNAVLTGFAAFGGTLLLLIAVFSFASDHAAG